MSAFLSRVDIVDDDELPNVPPLLRLTVTEELESLDFAREIPTQEYLYGLRHDSVEDQETYLQYMISMLIRVIETEYAIEVDGTILEPPEMANLLNRFNKKEEDTG